MNITFERATAVDAKAMTQIQITSFNDESRIYAGIDVGGPPGYDKVDTLLRKIAEDETYKIVDDGKIIGGLVVYDYGDGHYHLDLLFIETSYHNRGIGTQAMHFIEQAFPDAKKWTLNTPAYAVRNQHFYEKLGYVKVGEQEESADLILFDYEKLV